MPPAAPCPSWKNPIKVSNCITRASAWAPVFVPQQAFPFDVLVCILKAASATGPQQPCRPVTPWAIAKGTEGHATPCCGSAQKCFYLSSFCLSSHCTADCTIQNEISLLWLVYAFHYFQTVENSCFINLALDLSAFLFIVQPTVSLPLHVVVPGIYYLKCVFPESAIFNEIGMSKNKCGLGSFQTQCLV